MRTVASSRVIRVKPPFSTADVRLVPKLLFEPDPQHSCKSLIPISIHGSGNLKLAAHWRAPSSLCRRKSPGVVAALSGEIVAPGGRCRLVDSYQPGEGSSCRVK
jgi:hypothetical protein